MMPSMRWYTASTHQKHPPPRVTAPALGAGFTRGSLDWLTTVFGVATGLAVLSSARPQAAQQSRVVQLNNLRQVFIGLQIDAAEPIDRLGQAKVKMATA